MLDIGFKGGEAFSPVVPHAIGIDIDYPGYDGTNLPFENESVDCAFSSHCLEHVWYPQQWIRDQYRVVKCGGFIVCIVPDKFLYEKRLFPPSIFNGEHKRFFTPASLLALFEESLVPNSYRVRHLLENDEGFDYSIGPDRHSAGSYEIEFVLEKIRTPSWTLT